MNDSNSSFLKHLLRRRLDRVPPQYLRAFLEQQKIDVDKINTKQELLIKMMSHINLMINNKEFNSDFDNFLREFVLSARVSEYIIQVENTDNIFKWITKWECNIFYGQRYKFQLHTHRDLGKKFINFYEDKQGNIVSDIKPSQLLKDTYKNK